MNVKYILETFAFLTNGKIYDVLGFDNTSHKFLVQSDIGEKSWYPKAYFDVVNS